MMVVRGDVRHDVSPPLADLMKNAPASAEGQKEADEIRIIPHPPGFKPADEPDPVRQPPGSTAGAPPAPPASLAPTLLLNFDGIGQGTPPGFSDCCAPPDTNGAVGLTQYVQWVNVSFAIFSKSDGSLLAGPSLGNSIWTGFGGDCETTNSGDPIVVYDKLSDRWVFTQLAFKNLSGPFSQCTAVSTTSDAKGPYNRYQFGPYTTNGSASLNDYPKLGVWPDAYYITYNMFFPGFLGARACAWDRNAMLNGTAAQEICFQQSPSVGGLLPSDVDGRTPPPAGAPNYMLEFDVNSLNLYKFHVDFVTPGNSTFSTATTIPVAPFTPLCPRTFSCVPQQGTTTMLDSLGDRLMYRLAYRNFGDHESLVVSHSVVADPVNQNSGVRWYEIQNPGGTPTVAQQSTWAPDANFRWMGSIAMDQAGDMAVGYSVSSSTMFPSISIATRLASDPPSTLQPEISIMAGTGSQINGLPRWGDYSAMQVDPVDDCTFWYTTEYLKTTGSFNWNTRINSFKFPGCDKPDLSITVSHSGNYTQNQNGATFAVDVKNVGAKDTDGTQVTVTATLPTGLTATAASGTGWACTPGATTTCTRTDVLAANAAYPTITVTVNVAVSAPGFVTNTATVSGGGEVNPTNDTSSDVITVIQLGPDPTIAKTHSGPFIQGQTGSYTITVTNVGLSSLSGDPKDPVTVMDTLPTGLTANAASGTGWTCTLGPPVSCTRSDTLASNASYPPISLIVNIAGNAPSKVTNTATVSGGGDVNNLNNTANDPTTIIPPPPDLSITKTHSGNFNQGQSNASYTLTVSNVAGAGSTVGTVTVTDTVPTGLTVANVFGGGWSCSFTLTAATCTRTDVLPAGGSYPSIGFFVNVANNAPASVTNTATVSGGGDISPGNNTASDPTTINPSPDLTIAKSHAPDPFVVGSTGTYTITVSNIGSVPTSGTVSVVDQMPPGMIANAISATGWNCSGTTFVSCNRSDALAVNTSYPPITITVGVNAGDGGPVTNTATVSGGGEFNTANDTAKDVTNVNAPVLSITKSHVGNFTVGQNGTYTITVGNQGQLPTLGTAVSVTDTMPIGMTATAISATGWSCGTVPTTFLSCSRSDALMNGNSYPPIVVTVQIDPTTAISSVRNIAGVTGGGDLSVHSAFDPTLINLPDLTITKTHNGNFVSGETGAVYTIAVSNSGSVATAGGTVTINDFLPFMLTATAANGTGWTCTIPVPQQVDCTQPAGTLAPGASYPPITLTVNVSTTVVPIAVTNSATVSGIADANPSNNFAFDVTRIVMPVSITPTSPTTVTVSAGTAATFSFTANLSTNPPVGNVNLNIALLPPNSKATFSSNTITQSGTVTLTIDTSGNGHVASLGPSRSGRWTAVFAAVFFALFAFFSIKRSKQRSSKPWLWAGVGASGLVLALAFVGCGGGSTPPPPPPVRTPPGIYTMTITATSSNSGIPAVTVPVTVIVR